MLVFQEKLAHVGEKAVNGDEAELSVEWNGGREPGWALVVCDGDEVVQDVDQILHLLGLIGLGSGFELAVRLSGAFFPKLNLDFHVIEAGASVGDDELRGARKQFYNFVERSLC